jgi:hypothetical protein
VSELGHVPSADCSSKFNTDVVVSGHRYNLFEDFGPYRSVVDMVPSYFLVFGWPVAINAISLVYAGERLGSASRFGAIAHQHSQGHLCIL